MKPFPSKSPGHFLARAKACRGRLMARMDPRTLHEFRTCLRRLEAVLRLEKSNLGKPLYRLELEKMKYLRDLTGPFREAQVASRLLRQAGFPAVEPFLNGAGRKKVSSLQSILADPSFGRLFSELEIPVRKAERSLKKKKGRGKIRSAFHKERNKLREALRSYGSGGPRRVLLHRLRIRAKRIRYDLEQFAFLRSERRKQILKASERVQDLLGRLRDLQMAEKVGPDEIREKLREEEGRRLRAAAKAIQRLDHYLGAGKGG